MPDYFEIYHKHAGQYDLLVSREDYQHNLSKALEKITPFTGLDVVEFGAGTGRLTCMLVPLVKTIRAFDSSQHMLDVAIAKLKRTGSENWQVAIGDHRKIQAKNETADVVISGWSICYLVVGDEETWQVELSRGLAEMGRVLRKNGTLIIIETLGTGCETPAAPPDLKAYYTFLEVRGFLHTWVRTDYLFRDMDEAQNLTRFFFGDEMINRIKSDENGLILPECTGIWWQTNKHGGS